jgi:hypothetical protein
VTQFGLRRQQISKQAGVTTRRQLTIVNLGLYASVTLARHPEAYEGAYEIPEAIKAIVGLGGASVEVTVLDF